MMETKLWAALCALLLVNSGSADYSEDHTAAAPTSSSAPGTDAGPVTKAAYSEAVPTEHPTTHGLNSDPNPSLHDNSSLSNSSTASQEVTVVTLTPEKNENSASQQPSQSAVSHPPRPTSVDLPSTSHTTDSTTVISPTHVAHTFSVDVTATQLPDHNASRSPTPALPDSSSDQLSQPKTTSSTFASTSKSPKPEHTSAAFSTLSTSTPSTTSSHQPHNSLSSTHTSSSESHHETTTTAQLKSSTSTKLPSGPSAQAKTHTDNLSQLNGNDPTMVHDSPTLDPLLAGLVSGFIITAVIITLLLFLKLRRRDNRPEFRRLQDLPMDDMMEDTPLSMYSY